MPTSTAPSLRRPDRKRVVIALQIVFVAAVLWYAGVSIAAQWGDVRRSAVELRPRWGYVLASGAVVLVSYGLLIQTWRVMLRAWRAELAVFEASRIWFVSNLGKYLPGKVWQIAALAVMAQQRGISPVAATGASVIVNLANILSGFAVLLLAGVEVLDVYSRTGTRVAAGIVAALLAGLLLLPFVLPALATVVLRVTGRTIQLPRIPARAIWIATIGTGIAWVLYGLAFQLLVVGILGEATGDSTAYVAVFITSYLVGYLTLIAPGGIGVREAMMVAGLTSVGLTTEPRAWLLAAGSRLWLTILEVIPGVLFIARDALRRRTTHTS